MFGSTIYIVFIFCVGRLSVQKSCQQKWPTLMDWWRIWALLHNCNRSLNFETMQWSLNVCCFFQLDALVDCGLLHRPSSTRQTVLFVTAVIGRICSCHDQRRRFTEFFHSRRSSSLLNVRQCLCIEPPPSRIPCCYYKWLLLTVSWISWLSV